MRTVLGVALCAAAFAASAQVYRWTDEKGRVHVTDTPPPASAKSVRKSGGPASSPAAEPGQAAGGPEPYALQQARTSFPITLYTVPSCDGCAAARKLLNERGLPFREVSVVEEAQLQELKKVAGNASVPVLVVGSTVQRGFDPGTYQAMLDSAGYPKTGLLPPRNQAAPAPPAAPEAPEVKPVEEPERPTGPYAPGAPPQPRSTRK